MSLHAAARIVKPPIGTLMTDTFGVFRPRSEHVSISAQAQDWWSGLPSAYRPENLALQFPRVLNRVAACWNDLVCCDQYLRSLLVDLKRPHRQGFPPDVGLELMRLHGLRSKLPGNASGEPVR